MRRAARTPAPPNPSPYAPGGCTVSGPRLGQVLVTAAAVKMIRRATGGSILPSVVAVVDSHRAQGGERSVHAVDDGTVLHVLTDGDALVVAAEDEFDEVA